MVTGHVPVKQGAAGRLRTAGSALRRTRIRRGWRDAGPVRTLTTGLSC
jgi:hypothetical protein